MPMSHLTWPLARVCLATSSRAASGAACPAGSCLPRVLLAGSCATYQEAGDALGEGLLVPSEVTCRRHLMGCFWAGEGGWGGGGSLAGRRSVLPTRGRPAFPESMALARAVAQAVFHLPLVEAVAPSVLALACELPGFLSDARSKRQRSNAQTRLTCSAAQY